MHIADPSDATVAENLRLADAQASAERLEAAARVAHRPSTIRDADVIHFVEGGRIIESGSHQVLMARPNGAYRRFVALQSEGAPD